MPAAQRKGKKGRTGKKKGRTGRIPWGTLLTGVVIIAAAGAYLLMRYGAMPGVPGRTGVPPQKPRITVKLYFGDPQGEQLIAEQRVLVSASSLEERVRGAIEELLKGPQQVDLTHTIPAATVLRDLRMGGDRVMWLDFSSPLVSAHPGGSSAENMTIYSIVNTVLLNFKEVGRVGILIEGKPIDTLAGHIDCSRPFAADTTVIR